MENKNTVFGNQFHQQLLIFANKIDPKASLNRLEGTKTVLLKYHRSLYLLEYACVELRPSTQAIKCYSEQEVTTE